MLVKWELIERIQEAYVEGFWLQPRDMQTEMKKWLVCKVARHLTRLRLMEWLDIIQGEQAKARAKAESGR